MLIWICFAGLTAAVVAFVVRPLRDGGSVTVEPAASADVAVYRDQLTEIEAERERGVLSADEIESARAEVARRLIKSAGEGAAASKQVTPGRAIAGGDGLRWMYAIGALVPSLSIALYLMAGTPHLASQPFAARTDLAADQASVMDVIARVEARLKEAPDDGKGWDVVAPVYLRLGRYGDAAHAYAEASRLLGETPKRLIGFGQATLMINNGVVDDAVRAAATRVLKLEPGRIEPRIWMVLGREQDGDLKGALGDYRALLDGAPADAPWRLAVSDRIELLSKRMAGNAASATPDTAPSAAAPPVAAEPPRGPGAEDVARAGEMSPAEREAFITRMVDGLATRLKTNGRDLDGWKRLLRAYKVLGRDTDAVAALGEARRNFAGDQTALAEIDQVAKSLGLGS